MAQRRPIDYFNGLGGAFAGLILWFLPAAGVALVGSTIGALAWRWPFFTALLWTFGIVYGVALVITYWVSVNDNKPPATGGYPAGYMPNVHQMGTQSYYLNEIMNQQATENDRRRRQSYD